MVSKQKDDPVLDSLFEAARSVRPEPDAKFMARLSADVVASVPQSKMSGGQPSAPFYAGLTTLFAATGLSSAAALGVWIGFIMPDLIVPYSAASTDVAEISAFLAGADLSAFNE